MAEIAGKIGSAVHLIAVKHELRLTDGDFDKGFKERS